MHKDVYRVTFEVKAIVTMDVSANSFEDAENIAWDKYENSSEREFLQDAEIEDCVIDAVDIQDDPW